MMEDSKIASITPTKKSTKKMKIQPTKTYFRKLRSKIPRRKCIPRFEFSGGSSLPKFWAGNFDLPAITANSSSSACFPGEISGESSLVSARSEIPKKRPRSKEIGGAAAGASGIENRKLNRPITRSYYKTFVRAEEDRDFSGLSAISERNSRRRFELVQADPEAEEEQSKSASEAAISGLSCVEPSVGENSKKTTKGSRADESSLLKNAVSTATLSSISCIEQDSKPKSLEIPQNSAPSVDFLQRSMDSEANSEKREVEIAAPETALDLACSEQLSNESDQTLSDLSSCLEMTLSEIESEIFAKNSDGDYIDFEQQSILSASGETPDAFSDWSDCNSSPRSECFSLFLQFLNQFSSSTSPLIQRSVAPDDDDNSPVEFTMLRFEGEEEEESYKRLRSRERKHVYLQDYAKEYCMTTKYGNLVLQQRLLMVSWMIEHWTEHELLHETLFLGVNLLDRFLTRGFFTSKKNLQLLGIACCTLATRIEENQPLNSIRQKTFQVGSNVYRRCEVVAMEWLVQEVLNFECFMPTTYNFIWFYLKAAKADAEIQQRTKYLAILSLLDQQSLSFWPSTLAAGLVILASLACNRDSSCQCVMETHVRTKDDDLPECIQNLEWLAKYVR